MKVFFRLSVFYMVSIFFLGTLLQCSSSDDSATIDEVENSSGEEGVISAANKTIESYTINANVPDLDDETLALADNHDSTDDYEWDDALVIDIVLNGGSITTSSPDVVINGTTATITAAATYRISGTLTNGQIVVDTDDEATVKLLLDGVDITSESSSPLAIMNAEKAVVIVVEGTENYLTDAQTYVYADADEDEPDAALFSDDDLTIYGAGTLTVNGNYNEAIKGKDGLIIKDANITVTSVDDGIQGKDYLIIDGGTYHITTAGDGLKSDNDEDASLGFIQIDEGNFTIISGADAIQAETYLMVYGGEYELNAGGGNSAILNDDDSAKGLKAGSGIIVAEGTSFEIDTADDGVHSDNRVAIYGGTFTIATGDDGIHSDGTLDINGGAITISESYEGIEGANITINAGEIWLVSSDDGINAAGDTGDFSLDINGGYIFVNASGDGIDSNGNVTMTHGAVIINGPTGRGNGSLDYDGTFDISGGFLLAVGGRDMLQAPSSGSQQNSLKVSFSSSSEAASLVHLQNTDGSSLFSFAPAKSYQSVVFSSPELITGESYNLYLGGSSTGTPVNGLYEDGTYTSGTLVSTFTVSAVVTTVN